MGKAKAKDFSKVKLKVGKKPLGSNNQTNTNVRSKALNIRIPSALEKKTEITNSQRLTFKELITKCNHYSSNTRKEALLGIKDMFDLYPNVYKENMSSVSTTLLRLMTDETSIVRSELLNLYKDTFSSIEKESWIPFLPLIRVYLISTMSHIREDIRKDSLEFLNYWISSVNVLEDADFRNTVLEQLFYLLTNLSLRNVQNEGFRFKLLNNPDCKLSSSAKRIQILKCISQVMNYKTVKAGQVSNMSFESFGLFTPFEKQESNRIKINLNEHHSLDFGKSEMKEKTMSYSYLPVLIQCWIEAFNAKKPDLLTLTLECMKLFIKPLDNSDSEFVSQLLEQLKKHLFSNFPIQHESYAKEVNLLMMECYTLLIPSLDNIIEEGNDYIPEDKISITTNQSLLEKFTKKPKKQSQSFLLMIVKYLMNEMVYSENSPSLISVIGNVYHLDCKFKPDLFREIIQYYNSCPTNSSLKRQICQFICKVACSDRSFDHYLPDFVDKMPKYLCELGDKHVDLTSTILDTLIRLSNANPSLLTKYCTLSHLFLYAYIPKNKMQRFGPFLYMPRAVQVKFLNVIFAFPMSENLLQSLAMIFTDPYTAVDIIRLCLYLVEQQEPSDEFLVLWVKTLLPAFIGYTVKDIERINCSEKLSTGQSYFSMATFLESRRKRINLDEELYRSNRQQIIEMCKTHLLKLNLSLEVIKSGVTAYLKQASIGETILLVDEYEENNVIEELKARLCFK